MYDFDYNAILAEPIKSRITKNLIEGCNSCHKRITAAGITPILLRLDNEISSDLIDAIHLNTSNTSLPTRTTTITILLSAQSRHSKLTSYQS